MQRAVGGKQISQVHTSGPYWDCGKEKGAEMGRWRLKGSHSLEPWLCHSGYELWSPSGVHLQHRRLETQTDKTRVYLGAAFEVDSASLKRHESYMQIKSFM